MLVDAATLRFRVLRTRQRGHLLTLCRGIVITVILSLLVTGFFTMHSGINDCRDGYEYDWCYEESSMNVNGDLAVYLPEGSNVKELIEVVENDWTTNVMVIYVESEDYNVTTVKILDQIDAIENKLNPARNDAGAEDDIIYVLSISTVIKEVNSSAVRVAKAFFSGLAEASGNEELSDQMNETIDEQEHLEALHKLQKKIYDDQPYVFLYSTKKKIAIHRRFQQNNETDNQFRKRNMLIERPSVILNSLKLNPNYKDITPTIE